MRDKKWALPVLLYHSVHLSYDFLPAFISILLKYHCS